MAALPLILPVIGMMFLILVVNSLPIWTGITFLLSVTLLPLTITALAGLFIGPRILSLPPGKTSKAALYGLITAFAAFILWTLMLETASKLLGHNPIAPASGDIPAAAVIVA
ncbi:MAG: hypothetical protein WA997_13660 [Anaerolineales bacterium]